MIDPKFKTKLDGVNKVKDTIIKTTPSGSDNSNRSGSRWSKSRLMAVTLSV